MNEFKTYHPIVNFIYFVFVIGFSMFFMHPACLTISLLCGLAYSIVIGGRKTIKTNFKYVLPIIVATALINSLFNHEGITILRYLPSGNPLTLESMIYGLAAAFMIVSVICWFSCYNAVMTSDKFIYIFGRIIPGLSLIFSMTLRFVPRFITQMKAVTKAQRGIGRDVSGGSILKRAKSGAAILSIMVTWSLENAVETADSMKSRGYGLAGRSSFSVFTFGKRDKCALLWILLLGLYIFTGNLMGGMHFAYFPKMKGTEFTPFSLTVFAAYFALCIYPVVIELWEARRWKAIK